MKRVQTWGSWLGAVLVFSLIWAASASADPEWASCQKASSKTGSFSDKLCSVASPGAGKYELVAPSIGKGKPFKGKGGLAVLHLVIPGKGDITVKCQSVKDVGSVTVPNKVF